MTGAAGDNTAGNNGGNPASPNSSGGDSLILDPNASDKPPAGDGKPPASADGKPPAGDGKPPADKPGDGKPPADKGGKDGAQAIDLKAEFADLPEGMQLDEGLLGNFSDFLKDRPHITAEDAKALAGVYKQNAINQYKGAMDQHQEQVKQWGLDCTKDKEIAGASGKDFDANKMIARKALAAFGDDDLTGMLKSTGLGNHPAFVRMFLKIGKAISEDSTFARAASSVRDSKSPDARHADVLYGDMKL